ncbi:hypothetical protein KBY86_02120 [Synechococcus sp. Lug-A]|nr:MULTISPECIES: hypothetical protein [unclassified Synechococcus]MCP9827294.1 hypothetical protein [Synechococcus sp. L2F]MCP9845696.1 hypothetical protein [Synechococcus sp. Lug-A]
MTGLNIAQMSARAHAAPGPSRRALEALLPPLQRLFAGSAGEGTVC